MSEELGLTVKKSDDASEWYQQVVLKADFADYSPVKGSIVIKDWGYGVWEKIQENFDAVMKKHGVKNYYFPLLIPEGLLKKEAEHFAGFTPEVAWVTMAGEEKLDERLAIRPTSETIMYAMFSKWLKSYKELPLLVNQWCNIMRWETKMTKPFLRGREFLWQEGHTVHETREEAEKETDWALEEYRKLSEGLLAVPIIAGRKTDSDKFAGAEFTLAIETFTPDGKSVQLGTSHMLGQNFSKPYEVRFVGRDEKWRFGWQTSWGISTRMIGSMILVHGDDKGAVIPPRVAPVQAVIVPILFKGKEEPVLKKCEEIEKALSRKFRVELDARPDYTAGWKFNNWELKGVPLRIEIGPKDLENRKAVLVRRDTGEKTAVPMKDIAKKVNELLGRIQENLFTAAEKRMQALKEKPRDMAGLKKAMQNGKLALIPHCGKSECEAEVSEKTEGGPRIISEEKVWGNCINCGKPAAYILYWAKSY